MKPLFTGTEWTEDLIDKTWKTIDRIAKEKYQLDYYPEQIEIITSEQMLDAYSSVAMPIMYDHWSFGKTFLRNEKAYKKGITGLAYEVVINTDPCIAYLVENNTMTLQALVLAHALCGHGSFFKNNYLFKDWTKADTILDYLKFAKGYIKSCEDKYGAEEVEQLLDSCHSLQNNSIDKYKKPAKLSKEVSRLREKERIEYSEKMFSDIWRTLPEKTQVQPTKLQFPEENILYFLEKKSPILKPWQKEICRIVRKIAQYFYPQMQTGLMNEGWACFVHHLLMTELYEQNYILEGSYLEFLKHHTNVVMQPNWTKPYYKGINVYALGFAMMMDIKRICEYPTVEDKKWFPDICGQPWLSTLKDIVSNYRDESFILQFLSPKIIRDFKLFKLGIREHSAFMSFDAVHDDEDILEIRKSLAAQYDISNRLPTIDVMGADFEGDRWLYLEHRSKDMLEYNSMKKTVEHIHKLWGFPVKMTYKDLDGNEKDDI